MVPVRTCIGCRQQAQQADVVRFALEDGTQQNPVVKLDAPRRMPGRGAWLHPARECFDTAVARRAFHRAFRCAVDTTQLSAEALLQHSSTVRTR